MSECLKSPTGKHLLIYEKPVFDSARGSYHQTRYTCRVCNTPVTVETPEYFKEHIIQ